MKCQICNCEMGYASKPYWVIDTDVEKILAKGHAGCAREQEKGNPHILLLEAKDATFSPAQVAFASKSHRIRKRLQPEKSNESRYCGILLLESIGVSESLDQCLSTTRSVELLDWWQNGSKVLTAQQIAQVKARLRREFQMEEGCQGGR